MLAVPFRSTERLHLWCSLQIIQHKCLGWTRVFCPGYLQSTGADKARLLMVPGCGEGRCWLKKGRRLCAGDGHGHGHVTTLDATGMHCTATSIHRSDQWHTLRKLQYEFITFKRMLFYVRKDFLLRCYYAGDRNFQGSAVQLT